MVNDCYCCIIGSSNCAIARDIENEEKKPQSKKSLKSIIVPICLGVCVGALNLLNLHKMF